MLNPLTRLLLISTVVVASFANRTEGGPPFGWIHMDAYTTYQDAGWSSSYLNGTQASFTGPGAFSGILSVAPSPPSCGCATFSQAHGVASIQAIAVDEWVFNGDAEELDFGGSASASCVLRFHRVPSEGGSMPYELQLVGASQLFDCEARCSMVDGSWTLDLAEVFGNEGSIVTVPPGGDFELSFSIPNQYGRFHVGLRATTPTSTVSPSFASVAATSAAECEDLVTSQYDESEFGTRLNCSSQGGADSFNAGSYWRSLSSDGCICHCALTLTRSEPDPCWSEGGWTSTEFEVPYPLNLVAMSKTGSASFPFDPALLPLSIAGNSSFNSNGLGYGSFTLYFDLLDIDQDGWPDLNQSLADCNGDTVPDRCQLDPFTDADNDGLLDACQLGHGDFNLDGRITAADLAVLFNQWGSDGAADLDANGIVGPSDLAILLSYWG